MGPQAGSNVIAEVGKAMEYARKCHQEDIHYEAFDDNTGVELDPSTMMQAREEEGKKSY